MAHETLRKSQYASGNHINSINGKDNIIAVMMGNGWRNSDFQFFLESIP